MGEVFSVCWEVGPDSYRELECWKVGMLEGWGVWEGKLSGISIA